MKNKRFLKLSFDPKILESTFDFPHFSRVFRLDFAQQPTKINEISRTNRVENWCKFEPKWSSFSPWSCFLCCFLRKENKQQKADMSLGPPQQQQQQQRHDAQCEELPFNSTSPTVTPSDEPHEILRFVASFSSSFCCCFLKHELTMFYFYGRLEKEVDPPDSLKGWIVVFGSFVIHLFGAGMLYSWGVFILPLVGEFGVGRGSSSWIGSLAASV